MKIVATIFIALVSISCAYSPQQINVNPVINASAENYGRGRPVHVIAEDMRSVKTIGSRGGVYKDTSTITVANDINDAIAGAAKARLAVQGFNTNSIDENTTSLKVILESLSYDIPKQTLQSPAKKVLLEAVLRVEVKSREEIFTGRYKSNSERPTVVTPTMSRNEEMINEVLSNTLNHMFSDPKLKAFLSNI